MSTVQQPTITAAPAAVASTTRTRTHTHTHTESPQDVVDAPHPGPPNRPVPSVSAGPRVISDVTSSTVEATAPTAASGLIGIAGRVISPADPDYDSARQAWNLAVDQRPALVVQAAGPGDVAATVRYAAATGLRVAPQGTGHNAAPLGDLAGTILLRTELMRQVDVDPAALTVRVGAGVMWGEVTSALAPHGLAALSGSSADVGVVGYTLGGGYSWLSRRHGLAISKVIAAELVTADGSFHRVDAVTEPELFWAVRGGGANIGIVTALEFGVLPLPKVYAGSLFFPMARAREVLTAYARWSAAADDGATTCVRLLRVPSLPEVPEPLRGRAFAVIDGAIDAPAGQARALLAPLRALGPVMDTFDEMSTAALGAIHLDPARPVPGIGDGLILDELTDEAIQALLTIAGPAADTALLTVDLRSLGGAMARSDPSGGALDRLPGRYLALAVGIPMTPEVGARLHAELAALRAALAPWSSERGYGNFREQTAPAAHFFAAGTLARLQAVADSWDPAKLLQSNHSVR